MESKSNVKFEFDVFKSIGLEPMLKCIVYHIDMLLSDNILCLSKISINWNNI